MRPRPFDSSSAINHGLAHNSSSSDDELGPQPRSVDQHALFVKEYTFALQQLQLLVCIDATRGLLPFTFEAADILHNVSHPVSSVVVLTEPTPSALMTL